MKLSIDISSNCGNPRELSFWKLGVDSASVWPPQIYCGVADMLEEVLTFLSVGKDKHWIEYRFINSGVMRSHQDGFTSFII